MTIRSMWLGLLALSACKYHPPEPAQAPQYQAYGAPACGSPCYAPQNYGAPQYAPQMQQTQQAQQPYGAQPGYAPQPYAQQPYPQPYGAQPPPQPYAQPSYVQPQPRVQPAPHPAYVPPVAPTPAPRASSPFAYANQDPNDDGVVGPPDAIPDCMAKLAAVGARAGDAKLPVHNDGQLSCGAPQVVSYQGSSSGIKWSSPPVVTCLVALGLARFETILNEEAARVFQSRVKKITHMGSYSCRPMVRFNLVSEHSYANAIDIQAIELENGKRFTIDADWGSPATAPSTPNARFLRGAAERAYDEQVFSAVLSPAWDALHKDHLHLDQARYGVDGTRVRQR